jgi:type II restriction/modification system DNA methylase subunit YeeA
MFISTYELLRKIIINEKDISSLIQLEYSAFEEATVPVCTFTVRNKRLDLFGQYVRLSDFPGAKNQPIKVIEAINNPSVDYRFTAKTSDFNKIPSSPIAYWVSSKVREIFKKAKSMKDFAETRLGMATADNDRFLRMWYEVNFERIGFDFESREQAKNSKLKWFPYNKGGDFRKWYGNNDYVVNWEDDGFEIRNFKDEKTNKIRSHNYNLDYIFKESITWSFISSANFGVRYSKRGFLFDVGGSSLFTDDKYKLYLLSFLCSKLAFELLRTLNPTMNFQPGNISSLPILTTEDKVLMAKIERLSNENIVISKYDWDSFEVSWDFKKHPLLTNQDSSSSIEVAMKNWSLHAQQQFNRLKKNEEDLNSIFIEIYGLQGELSPVVDEDNVTIRRADKLRDIKSFISYGVGCMFGRYSLDEEGLVFAGGKFDPEKYKTFQVDKDNIIPILSGAYFEDDIVSRFIEFVKVTFGEETLEENLEYIADTLGKKEGETAKETIRRYFLNDFFKDHVQTYKKRPIYWLFTSGKQKAFNCLIYMHRYDKTTLSRIRTDYLHPLQIRLDAERKSLLEVIEGGGTAKEISNAKKELKQLDLKIEELKAYDEVLHHMADMQIEIDLDDGVAVNYAKFNGLLAKLD